MDGMLDYQGDDELARDLFKNALAGKWPEVVELYEKHGMSAIFATINTSGDTAFHIAVSIAAEDIVEKLVHSIADIWESGLWIKNNDGNTPLHVAASTGKLRICLLIADNFDFRLSRDARNNAGESPLFLAAFYGHKVTFLYLQMLLSSKFNEEPETGTTTINPFYRRNDGETILHCVIRWEYFDLAFEISNLEPELTYCRNEKGFTPLHLLASKPSVFKSGCHLGWWKNIIYLCIHVEELKKETLHLGFIDSVIEGLRESSGLIDEYNNNFPANYETCIMFFQLPWIMAKRVIKSIKDNCKGRNADVESHGEQHDTDQTSKQKGSQSRSEARGIQFIRRPLAKIWFTILYISYTILKRIFLHLGFEETRKLKQKHVHSVQIMKMLIKDEGKKALNFSGGWNPGPTFNRGPEDKLPSLSELGADSYTATASKTDQQDGNKRSTSDSEDKKNGKETPMLLAVGNGITEMVEHIILNKFSLAISVKSDGKNIVLSAMKNRQTRVLQLLFKQDFVKHKLIHELHMMDNNALHLAAELGEQKPWLIPGAALQMQWEIKWYEFVKDKVPQHFRYQVNREGKTPEDIFNKRHEQLVKDGGEWLNKTSESCSVVAALIATVAFAASTTIPGDINDKSGIPNLENQSAVTIFAISSLIALCFSITALFSFLAILTSRYEQKDFHRNLPMKLLIGLTSLFVSIASMLVSFCAGHYFTLKNKLKDKAFPVYAVTCLPIVFFAIQQLPLYLDIIWAIYKKVPRSSYKVTLGVSF
ncbi:hypothetical protein ACB092_10G205500 [Castanea dentata]